MVLQFFLYFSGKTDGVLNMELLPRCTRDRLLGKQRLEFRDLSEIYQCLYDTHKQRHQTRLVDIYLKGPSHLNPRPAGGPGFPRPAGGGVLLGHIAIRDRRRSKDRQK